MVGVVEDGAGHAGGVLHTTQVGDGAHVGRLAGKTYILLCMTMALTEYFSIKNFIQEHDKQDLLQTR